MCHEASGAGSSFWEARPPSLGGNLTGQSREALARPVALGSFAMVGHSDKGPQRHGRLLQEPRTHANARPSGEGKIGLIGVVSSGAADLTSGHSIT